MDPTTTLFTFMLQTHPSVQSVHLLGSWDNFSQYHTMERDIRRDRSEWRGCHTFENIICDGDQIGSSTRNGGLKMGQTYYYYYELDGSTETHDPSLPTTSTCPYLPGQTVNTLEVPHEHQLRLRSASMNSLRSADFKTMDPQAKFTTPRPAPPVPGAPEVRVGSSPSVGPHRSARSLSPAPRWTGAARRFFGGLRPQSRGSDRGRSFVESDSDGLSVADNDRPNQSRSATPSGSIRSRDISPESLRRFLSDDLPCTPPNVEPPKLSIPDDIVEENEDDDNFATSAASDSAPFTTLSPPPFVRSLSPPSVAAGQNQSTATIVPETPAANTDATPAPAIRSMIPNFKLDIRQSHFSFSTISSGLASPTSPQSTESRDFSQVSFFDDLDDEEADEEEETEESLSNTSGSRQDVDEPKQNLRYPTQEPFTGYSLPQAATTADKVKQLNTSHLSVTAIGSPALVARSENGVPVGSTNLLGRPGYDSGLDDLVSDMSWMAGVILPKHI